MPPGTVLVVAVLLGICLVVSYRQSIRARREVELAAARAQDEQRLLMWDFVDEVNALRAYLGLEEFTDRYDFTDPPGSAAMVLGRDAPTLHMWRWILEKERGLIADRGGVGYGHRALVAPKDARWQEVELEARAWWEEFTKAKLIQVAKTGARATAENGGHASDDPTTVTPGTLRLCKSAPFGSMVDAVEAHHRLGLS